MKYSTLDLLACPVCKHFPLVLRVLKEIKLKQRIPADDIPKPFCKTYCGFQQRYVMEIIMKINCVECLSKDILWGLLCCPQCKRVYMIFYGVPLLYHEYLWRSARLKILHGIFIDKTKISYISCNSYPGVSQS